MSRTKRFLGGVSLGYAYQFLLTVVGLWLTPFLLRRVGQHDYGLWLVGAQLLAYLSLMDFGIVALLPRATAYATGRAGSVNDAKDLPEIVGQTAWVVLFQTPLVAVAALILWFTIPGDWGPLRMPIAIVMLAFVLAFPLRIFGAVLQGLQDLAFLGRVNIIAWLAGTALTIALVLAGDGLYALAYGWVLTQVLTAAVCYVRLRRTFAGVLPRTLPRVSGLQFRRQLKQGFWISVAQIAGVLTNGTDLIIVGLILGPLAVVPYACTAKLISVLANQPQMLMQAAFPGLSEMRTAESPKRLFEVCSTLSLAMIIMSGAIVCVVLAVNRGFVQWWVGANQYGGFVLTSFLIGAMLLRQWNTSWIYPLLCFGRERRISITNLLDGLTTALLSLVLVWQFGARGAPVASMIGVCFVSLVGNLYAVSRELNVTVSSLVKIFIPWLWRFTIVALAASMLNRFWVPRTFISLALATIVTSAAYLLLMLPLLFGSELGGYVKPRLIVARTKAARAFSFSGTL
jgi:O-antigen/teichoic acid export membrane protein